MRTILSVAFLSCTLQANAQQGSEYSIMVESRVAKSKEKQYGEWKAWPTRAVSTLQQYKPAAIAIDKYGGRTDVKLKSTGYFSAVKEKDRWWIADPDGNAFINIGVVSVSAGPSDSSKLALQQQFGDVSKWATATYTLLRNNGFNSLGAWSDVEQAKAAASQNKQPFSYTIIKNFMSDYGKQKGGVYQQAGHMGYPDNTIFVFDPEFETFCDKYAQQLAANKNDKNLFGYFSDNELPFERLSLDRYLGKKDTTDHGYQAARRWIEERGISKTAITDSVRHLFLGFMADRYYSIVARAIKKYDPNHLYLGSRLHFYELKVKPFFEAVGRYVDVIAINYYRFWTPVAEDMKNWEAWSGKPFLVTEWYTKGMDSGMPNYSGAGWIVRTQEERGLFYQNFALGLLESGNCVGFQWFKYQDNDPANINADPSNTDANKGIVSNRYKVYQPLLDKMKELNTQVYSLIDFFDARKRNAQ